MGLQQNSNPCRFCRISVCATRYTPQASKCTHRQKPHKPRTRRPSHPAKLHYPPRTFNPIQKIIRALEGAYA